MSRMSRVLTAAVPLLAATAFAVERPTPEQIKADVAAVFAQADADSSGALSPEEFADFHERMRALMESRRFDRIDADDDGVVTAAELEAGARRGGRRRGPPPF